MSGARARRAPPALLPGARTPSALLVLVVLALSVIAGLDLAAATVAARTAQAWRERVGGSVTVAVAGRGLASADAAAARAAEILALAPGVRDVRVLEPAPGDGLAATAMGLDAGGADGAPRLLAASLSGGAADPARILRRQGFVAAADDHSGLNGPLERLALAGAGAAAALLLIMIALLCALAGWGARRAARRFAARLDLLARLGAAEKRLSAPMASGPALGVVLGAVLGSGAAAGLAAGALWLPQAQAWLAERGAPTLVADGWELAAIALWPALALLIAPPAARSGADRAVRDLP